MEKLPEPEYSKILENFEYDAQFKKYAIQFMALFSDVYVTSGKNDLGSKSNKIYVPIKYGTSDRVAAAIMANNNQNTTLRLPIMAAKITNISMAPEKKKGIGQTDRRVFLPRGKSLPDELQVIRRLVPVPYNVDFELSILASNTEQQFQILEPILQIFDPLVQFQTSDDPFDWTKINTMELTGINLEENYPSATDRRSIVTSLTFTTTIYLSAPVNLKQDYIKKVELRLATIHTYENAQEVAEDVDRVMPEYKKLFDIQDMDIPKN